MPIYEYLCPVCNRVYSFFAKSFSVSKEPTCPKCGATDLRKMVSRFAVVRSAGGGSQPEKPTGESPGEPDPFDDPRTEREMMRLLGDAEHMDENDPKQLGRLMRRMSEISGEPLEPEMEEAMRRLESGEDPDKIEEDMGDLFGDEGGPGMGPPSYDDDLYPM
jgi:putative FmdB family regulatory protein